jgi:hypothetical protein
MPFAYCYHELELQETTATRTIALPLDRVFIVRKINFADDF